MKRGVVALLFLAGCAAARTGTIATEQRSAQAAVEAVASNDASVPTGPSTPSVGAPVSPVLLQRFEGYARSLQRDGVRFDGVVAHGFLAQGQRTVRGFDVPAGACWSLVGIASPGVGDLDARLYSPEGDTITEDVESDPHPTVQLCAGEARRVYHVIDAYEGQGAYAIGLFVAPDRRGLDAMARVVGGRPGTAISAASTASEGDRRLAELRDGIARRGFVPGGDGLRARFSSAPGALRYPVNVTPDRCYTLAAFAEDGVSDADLVVFDPDGEEVARDVRPERDAFVQLCPAVAGSLAIELRVRAASGPGAVLLQTFSAEATTLGGANALWLGERTSAVASAIPLERASEELRAAMQRAGATLREPVRWELTAGESRTLPVNLPAGRCSGLAAVPGRGLGRVPVELYANDGALLARSVSRLQPSVAVYCASEAMSVLARVRAEVGAGPVATQGISVNPPGAWAQGIDRAVVNEALGVQLALTASEWTLNGTEAMRVGGRALRSREVDVAAGRCGRFVVTAGPGYPWFSVALRALTGGAALAEARGEGTVAVVHCANTNARVRVEVTVDPPAAQEFDGVLSRFERVMTIPPTGDAGT